MVCIAKKQPLNAVFSSMFHGEARHGKAFEGLLKRYFG